MTDNMFTCNDCGSTGPAVPPTAAEPWHQCANCSSGFVSRIDTARSLENVSRKLQDMRSRGFDTSNATLDHSGNPQVTYRLGNWLGRYSGGHIEIAHADNPDSGIDMINTYDYDKGEHRKLTSRQVAHHMENWSRDYGSDYLENRR